MPFQSRALTAPFVLAAFLGLAACDSNEDRAEAYYQWAMSLIEQGDIERAKVELRNVFQYDRFHEAARRAFADIDLSEDNPAAAYRHYRFIVEQQPELADVRLTMAELAYELGDLEEARRNGEAAIGLVPEDPRAQVLAAAFAYNDAIDTEDTAAAGAAAEEARVLLAQAPDNGVARRVVIDEMLRSGDPTEAMPAIDEALEIEPESYQYNYIKLQLLSRQQDMAGVGAQLRRMVTLFPEDEELSSDLIRWYMAENDLEGAETYLRELAGEDTGPTEGHLTVVQFLQMTQDTDAARAELERLAAANDGTAQGDLYTALAQVIRFEAGERDEAIATLENIVATEREDGAETRARIRNMLARMLIGTGNTVGARAQVEEVLAADPSSVEALKLRAAWAIQDDAPQQALTDLRTALNQAPRDPEVLTLMAEAHQRDGARALAGERLAQAVEVTDSRAAEALRYVSFLLEDGRRAAALTVLADARAANPQDVTVLTTLGQQLLAQQSWLQVRRITDDLREIGTPEALEAANTLEAATLAGQGRLDDSLAFLQEQLQGGTTDTRTVLQLVQLNLRNNNPDEARRVLDEALAQTPDDVTLRLTDAELLANAGDAAAAEERLRAIVADAPENETAARLLYTLLRNQDRADEASTVLQAALERQPEATTLYWIRAGELERSGDIDGAIEIYETLYESNTGNELIANNLASLISSYRDDPDSLARAEAIARRLRDTDQPAYQDTYGWIAYRQGNYAEAETYLASAAEGLPQDPTVQAHYGLTLAALERPDAARPVLTRALELGGDGFALAETVRTTLDTLPAAGTGESATPSADDQGAGTQTDGTQTDTGLQTAPADGGDGATGTDSQTAPQTADPADTPDDAGSDITAPATESGQ